MYYFDILDGSADEFKTHPNPFANGGNPGDLWVKKAVKQYENGDYDDAYDYIGCILHLDQDQAVPAHAFDIQHVGYFAWGDIYRHFGDDLEKYAKEYADVYSHLNSASIKGGISSPFEFYGDMIETTRSAVNNNAVLPPEGQNWTDYWTNGVYGPRRFPNHQDTEKGYVDQHDNMVSHRITDAISYSAGNLAAASKILPPTVKDIEIYPATETMPEIDTEYGTQIEFKILENRTQIVKIYITVGDQPIISDEYGTGKVFNLSNGSELPWEGDYSITWDGKLADGKYPSNGIHILKVYIDDDDGNRSVIVSHEFSINIDLCEGVNIDDKNACTTDSCDPETGEVSNETKSDEEIGLCNECVDEKIVPRNIDDKNACTTDSCDPETGDIINEGKSDEEIGPDNKCVPSPDDPDRIIIVPKDDGGIGLCEPGAKVLTTTMMNRGLVRKKLTDKSYRKSA
jgi:hypothetical protein